MRASLRASRKRSHRTGKQATRKEIRVASDTLYLPFAQPVRFASFCVCFATAASCCRPTSDKGGSSCRIVSHAACTGKEGTGGKWGGANTRQHAACTTGRRPQICGRRGALIRHAGRPSPAPIALAGPSRLDRRATWVTWRHRMPAVPGNSRAARAGTTCASGRLVPPSSFDCTLVCTELFVLCACRTKSTFIAQGGRWASAPRRSV